MKKRIFFGAAIVVLLLLVWFGPLLLYGLRQGYGQLRIVWLARPVEEFLADPAFPDSLKRKLTLIQEVRRYAIDPLGLLDTENYKQMYDQHGEEIMWVVTACEPFALKEKRWDFPVVGSMPYKGFFRKERAIAERDALKAEGWDTNISNPSGWSTLGWFNDPILSDMLQEKEGELASTIIHEMVHATIFVKDSADFNENLASFIGDAGAQRFLDHRFGPQSKESQDFINDDLDYRRYAGHVLAGTIALDSLYHSFTDALTTDEKRARKDTLIARVIRSMDTLTLAAHKSPSTRFRRLPNNTYFMSFRRYQAKVNTFRDECRTRFNNNFTLFIRYYREHYPYL